jgi:hypothetical protein
MRSARANLDGLQEWVDSIAAHPWSDSEIPAVDQAPAVHAAQVDLAAGEFFRTTWHKRLAAAQGDFAHVARQMRKAGVPLELALAVLLSNGAATRRTAREPSGNSSAEQPIG